jgi:hypothetical protein
MMKRHLQGDSRLRNPRGTVGGVGGSGFLGAAAVRDLNRQRDQPRDTAWIACAGRGGAHLLRG